MNLRGGVLIIGSLMWEESSLRRKWRSKTFKDVSNPIYNPAKIRYGRVSKKRDYTHTMILSNHPATKPGKALILELKRPVKSFGTLEKLAYELAEAEGIFVKPNEAKLASKWGGAVGLWLNPKVDQTDAESADNIRKKWAGLYSQYEYFKPAEYAITKKEVPVIDGNGILKITSTKQMLDFDFLLATPTKPNPQKQVTARQIAEKIIKTGNGEYFYMNREHKISTFQDKDILKLLKAHRFKP